MKKIYLFFTLLTVCLLSAQNVSFLDLNFKSKILSSGSTNQVAKNLSGAYFSVDANGDNEISLMEAQQVSYLDVSHSTISNIYGISSFTNLHELRCNNNTITNIDLSALQNLNNIDCQFNNLNTLKFHSPAKIIAANNSLNTINISGSNALLTDLNISNNNFSSFILNFPALVNFHANGNPLTSLSISGVTNPALVLHPIDQLQTLSINNFNPAQFTVANFPNLTGINGSGLNSAGNLVLNNLPALNYAQVNGNAKVTVQNVNPGAFENGLNFNINELLLKDISNTTTIKMHGVQANKYRFENLSSVSNLSFLISSDATEVTFNNLPVLDSLKIGKYTFPNTCQALNISTIPSLKSLTLEGIKYSSLNLNNLNLLTQIIINAESCDPNSSVLTIANLPSLQFSRIEDSLLKSIYFDTLSSLNEIQLLGSNFINIGLTNLPTLNKYKYSYYDSGMTNTVGSLNFVNLPSLTEIYMDKPYISALVMTNLPLLHTFKLENTTSTVYSPPVIPFNFSNLPLLQNLTLNSSKAAPLTLSNLPLLKTLNLSKTTIGSSYTFQDLPQLETINISEPGSGTNANDLNNVSFTNLPSLKTVDLMYFYHLSSLNFGNTKSHLENFSINLSNGTLNTMDFTDFTNLKNLFVDYKLTSITLSNLPLLHTLHLIRNKFTNLNVNNLPSLLDFKCNYNQPSTGSTFLMNIDTVPILKKVDVNYNGTYLKNLDLSQVPQLEELYFNVTNSSSPLFVNYLNLKNGNPAMLTMDTSFIKNICVDDDNEKIVLQNLQSNLANTIFTPYCTFYPAGNTFFLTGYSAIDANSNGCDPQDSKIPFLKYNINLGGVINSTIANSSGNYTVGLPQGIHTISPLLENPSYFNSSPPSYTIDFLTALNPSVQNFCLSANGNHNDLEIAIIPITAAVPGFTSKYRIIYKNKGTAAQSGTIAFSYDDNLMNFTTATVAPTSQTTGTLSWNFTNLLPFEKREVTVTFTLNTPTATPPLTGGHILNYTAQVTGATDETPADNNFTLNQTVVNSFDPNDKTCLQGTAMAQAQVGDYVHYLIRFENTGTANAQNIVVKDIIDTSKFDLSSLVAIDGSHSFITRITGPNTVEFIFENIQLPFANATNDGYVVFKIKTLTTLSAGNAFSNTANIYFDYNAPIITNTYTTTVQQNLSTAETVTESFSIYPNPVKDVLHFKTKERILKAEVFDLSGRIVRSSGVSQNSMDLSELPKGNYLIRIYTKDQIIIKKLIKD